MHFVILGDGVQLLGDIYPHPPASTQLFLSIHIFTLEQNFNGNSHMLYKRADLTKFDLNSFRELTFYFLLLLFLALLP